MAGKTNVTMERENCISCGNCWTVCPDFFEENGDDAQSQIMMKFRIADSLAEGEAPEELEECVKSAAEGCPAEVIHIG